MPKKWCPAGNPDFWMYDSAPEHPAEEARSAFQRFRPTGMTMLYVLEREGFVWASRSAALDDPFLMYYQGEGNVGLFVPEGEPKFRNE